MDGNDAIIESLREQIRKLTALVERQAAQLELQAKEIADLKLALAKAKKDSSTSSKPPSGDITRPKARMDLLDQSPVLLGPPDTGHPVFIREASRQEDQGLGRTVTGSVAAAVFGLAPPRRDDGRGNG